MPKPVSGVAAEENNRISRRAMPNAMSLRHARTWRTLEGQAMRILRGWSPTCTELSVDRLGPREQWAFDAS